MSHSRDESGRFESTITDQQLLKVFDYEDDPVLTTTEVTEGLGRFGVDVTTEAVRRRLDRLAEEGAVSKKQFGARAVGWWAEVAPTLSAETAARVTERRDADEWSEL
ncbi:hypothetical protein BRD16_01490 [Halobacteriales archaeon SW_6_65_46]|nr:MAG: hypothetical protein BRD16_01490 [Halobacteriales archaeon SW_6_65_46]